MKSLSRWFMLLMMISIMALAGCSGDDGSDGKNGMSAYEIAVANGYTGTEAEWLASLGVSQNVEPESCATCHAMTGSEHQEMYDNYTDTSALTAKIFDVATTGTGPTYNATVIFGVSKSGLPVELADIPRTNYGWGLYNSATGKVDEFGAFDGPKTIVTDPPSYQGIFVDPDDGKSYRVYETSLTGLDFDFETSDSFIHFYFAQEPFYSPGGRVTLYNDVANAAQGFGVLDTNAPAPVAVGPGGEYISAANVSGCVKCHNEPYGKHGYRYAQVDGIPDFMACKVCHGDSRPGGHEDWQQLVDDPLGYATGAAYPAGADYSYFASVMNDTHMSHAMEFPYPQTMANCVTCHEGKLDLILTEANFNLTTCKSCHPVQGDPDYPSNRAPALLDVIPAFHGYTAADLYTGENCQACHTTGGFAEDATFSSFHSGYNEVIYYAEDKKYSDAITVTFNSATIVGTDVTIVADVATNGFDAADVELGAAKWGLYAYDSDDLLVSREDATTAAADAYISDVTTNSLKWTMNADLSAFADQITSGMVNRAQIMIQPVYHNGAGEMVALNAPTEIIKLADGSFDAPLDIVDTNKCNNCHDALGTTFHSPDRGGNIEACKTCHVVTSGGSHLEMQSRSIDSYVHAIHSMQPFDYGDIDFDDPVEAVHYEHHIESFYPTFGTIDCESCHNPGTYNVPDQTVSLAAVQSSSDSNATTTRKIGDVPSYITGPAASACGACHKAMLINEDDASALESFNQHVKKFGYLVEDGDQATIWETIQSYFD